MDGAQVAIGRRSDLAVSPAGDLLQAGPLLVRGGAVVHGDAEGFSAGSHQFDSDITAGRHPRAAIGLTRFYYRRFQGGLGSAHDDYARVAGTGD